MYIVHVAILCHQSKKYKTVGSESHSGKSQTLMHSPHTHMHTHTHNHIHVHMQHWGCMCRRMLTRALMGSGELHVLMGVAQRAPSVSSKVRVVE